MWFYHLYEVFHQRLLQQKLQPGSQANYREESLIRHIPRQVLIFRFSPRGRGKPKSLINSPLPLSYGMITNHPLAFPGLSMEPSSLLPLPPLPSRRHDKKDEHHLSDKVTYSSQTMTDHKSATSTTNQNNPFEGKPSFTDPSLPNWNMISSMIIINQMKIIYLPSTIISIHWIQSITKVRIFIWIFQFIVYLLLDVIRSVY
jgi:hypothetical protein